MGRVLLAPRQPHKTTFDQAHSCIVPVAGPRTTGVGGNGLYHHSGNSHKAMQTPRELMPKPETSNLCRI